MLTSTLRLLFGSPVLAQAVPAISGWQIAGTIVSGAILELIRRQADATRDRVAAVEKRVDALDDEATESRHDLRNEIATLKIEIAVLKSRAQGAA